MLNPFSWTLDGWFFALQVLSFVVLGVTVAVGYFLSTRQAGEIAEFKIGLATAKEKQADAEAKLEAERQARLEVEKAISPRVINQGRAIPALRHLAGTKVVFEHFAEAESSHITSQIAFALMAAGWKVVERRRLLDDDSNVPDGISIITTSSASSEPSKAGVAAIALNQQLKADNMETNIWVVGRGSKYEQPQDTVFIQVGFKPSTFFLEGKGGNRAEGISPPDKSHPAKKP